MGGYGVGWGNAMQWVEWMRCIPSTSPKMGVMTTPSCGAELREKNMAALQPVVS